MRINFNGNVGIGTSSPGYLLDVAGNARLNASSNPVLIFSEAGTWRGLITSSSSLGLAFETNGALPLYFNTNATERMRIDGSGNVGIGTASPSSKLDVNGTITATTFGTSSQNAFGARTVSTSSPTGGSDGDIWYKY